jgi:hypothetical protein
MSIYDKASLVHIPSGVKSGTLYNVLPNTADGDFDFSRGSTGTRVNKDGLIETVAIGVPRLNYPLLDGVVQDCPTLLLEPSRQNYTAYSAQFDNSYWAKATSDTTANPTVTANVGTSPDGGLNADRVQLTAPPNNEWAVVKRDGLNTGATVGSKLQQSLYLKAYDSSQVGKNVDVYMYDFSNTVYKTVYKYTLTADWQRVVVEHTITGASTSTNIQFAFGKARSTVGGSTQSESATDFLVWGAQLEKGTYPTSYIPTSGSTETRSADAANGAEATFNDSEGVLYANVADFYDSTTSRVISISDGTLNNRVFFKFYTVSNGIEATLISSSGGTNPQITTTTSDTSNYNKIALKYSSNGFNLWANGFELGTDTVTNLPNNLSDLSFDTASLNPLYGKTKEVMTFNEALSDTELEALTSYSSFNEMATEQLYTIE